MNVDRATAETYARCFACLGDATRVLILNLLAGEGRPLSVGEIVDAVDVGQSTVSRHLKILAEVGFVIGEREGTSSYWRVNELCLDHFPSAADVVMGRVPPPQRKLVPTAVLPWLDADVSR